ncbi:MAG: VCBS repeat-containing protein [Chloroflexi bacterium]|nr:VCBS repeat-containing protein [Chloroflexota bacterium]
MKYARLFWSTTLLVMLTYAISTSQIQKRALAAPNSTTVVLGGDRIYHSSPAAADLNGNGYKEIAVGAKDGMLYVVAYNGTTWSKVWERQTATDLNAVLPGGESQPADGIIDSAPAIADIDNDGDLEIVVTTGGVPNGAMPSLNRHGSIIVYERTSDWTFTVKSGWPVLMPDAMGSGSGGSTPDGIRDGIGSSPSLGDLDGDGDLEIVTMTYDRIIRAYHHNGTAVNGWPIQRPSGDPILRGGESTAAIGDIDNDGLDEVVIGTNSPPWNGDNKDGPFPAIYNNPDYTRATVWAINGDSTHVPGWPVITEQVIKSSPAIGDIDGDGDLEIVVGTGNFGSYINGHQVYAWHGNGTAVSGWPKATGGNMLSSPALADLDKDGVLDVIIGCGSETDSSCKNMYAWHGNGTNLPGFPMTTSYPLVYPPIVADVDGDNNLEILQTSNHTRDILVIQHNGTSGSINTSRSAGDNVLGSPLVDDLDNDGKMETVAASASGGQAALFIFEETTTFNDETAPWPTFHQNAARTGLVLPPELSFASSLTYFHQTGTGNTAVLIRSVKNSGGGELDWSLNLSGTGGAVSADVTSGTLAAGESAIITLTVDTTSYAEDVWHNLGTMTMTATNSGSPVNNSPINSPVKLYIGQISNIYLPFINK